MHRSNGAGPNVSKDLEAPEGVSRPAERLAARRHSDSVYASTFPRRTCVGPMLRREDAIRKV
jgi:hypothetical protein